MARVKPKFDGKLILMDAAERGLHAFALAKAVNLAPATVTFFVEGKRQTVNTAAKIAAYLGQPVSRYMVATKGKR